MMLAAFYHPILATLFGFLCLMLMGVILLQRGRGVGLAGAFGGAGGQQAFGAKTGDFLTWATIVVAVVFMVSAVLLNYMFVPPSANLAPPTPSITAPPPPDTGAPIEPGTLPVETEQPATPASTDDPQPAGTPADDQTNSETTENDPPH